MKVPRRVPPAYLLVILAAFVPQSPLAQTGPSVGVMAVAVGDVSPKHEFVGRVEAMNAVDIRSRIEGFIDKRLFNEGQAVKSGQDLFLIDSRALDIALADAKASLASAQATLADAQRRVARNKSLSSQTVSRATLEESQTALETGQANLLAAQARVSQAELNLSYARISSPIEGRIGAAQLSDGSFVSGSSMTLARVVEMDPIRVVFSVTDRSILELRAAAGGISKDELAGKFVPTLRLSNGQEYKGPGKIEFFGNEIDEATGTLSIRTLFPNPDFLLVPGQFVTVIVSEAEKKMRPIVPLGAVQQDREGKFVLLVNENNEVALRRIKVSEQVGGNWAVDDGLKGGESLIVEGIQNVAEGLAVTVTQASPANNSVTSIVSQSGSSQ
ncbi:MULTISPECIES: efflux RND transporter periplasmic adaptor subunit [Rhizobium]|uniref:RND family efflux transporter, MFP subunit n=1 Tax=Rhizobium favelukesii TaxID=348824 RepID=W6S7J6_9HYPH|nr:MULTISPECIES: efflux RND transporter periplasmic adaptor subunit [Rhizobium]MCS0461912.1 efflux RND transporter periplasmic adaptor subunit [Rhizobium favelukesii]UFS80357.1 efflux RND transporter periplasmic adaptor subunit [Rhizobium sp. T136]CDM62171.1 RND family efflux transporter, MFP subunit [Rhizobium favelukesii]